MHDGSYRYNFYSEFSDSVKFGSIEMMQLYWMLIHMKLSVDIV